jgi:hypothetical protein
MRMKHVGVMEQAIEEGGDRQSIDIELAFRRGRPRIDHHGPAALSNKGCTS